MKARTHEPFLPNVIKFYPFPELVPEAAPVALEGAPRWPWTPEFEQAPDPAAEGALLYVHVPYCDFFCHYCPLYKTTRREDYDAATQQRYVAAILRELRTWARRIAPDRELVGIYFGGGTPTSLPVPLLGEILRAARDEFQLRAGAELTVEGIPSHFARRELVDSLVALGVDRISFGAQTLQEAQRRALGRGDSVQDCFAAVEAARAAGIGHVNVDLMYGYPGQSVEDFARDVEAVGGLGPDTVDFYYYMQIMGTAYRKRMLAGRLEGAIPLAEMRHHLLTRSPGWQQLSTECFGRAGQELPRIWSHTCGGSSGLAEIIALGPSSYGQVGGWYYYNRPDLAGYLAEVDAGRLPLRGRLRLRGQVLGFRLLNGGILLGRIPRRLVPALPRVLRRRVGRWLRRGLIADRGDEYRLTPEGNLRFQMLACECVPPASAFVMMRRYMMNFDEQRKLLFSRSDLLYARSVAGMIRGALPGLAGLREAGYRMLLLLPNRLLDWIVDRVAAGIRWSRA